jgi:hypothetical protein
MKHCCLPAGLTTEGMSGRLQQQRGYSAADRQFQHRQQENIFPLPFINPVSKIAFQWHTAKIGKKAHTGQTLL